MSGWKADRTELLQDFVAPARTMRWKVGTMKDTPRTLLTLTAFGVIASIGSLDAEPTVVVTDDAEVIVATPAEEPEVVVMPDARSLDADPGEEATVKGAATDVLAATVTPDKVVVGQAKVVEGTPKNRRIILIEELDGVITPRGPLISLSEEVLFDYDKSDIKPNAALELGKVAELIKLTDDYYVEVAGFTDDHGSKDYNSDLAWRRSQEVVKWFTSQEAFAEARFRAIGRGEAGDVAPNEDPDGTDNPEGRALNRRVEILIRDQAARPNPDDALNPRE